MLLRFRLSNFRSFRDEAELSMVATRRDAEVAIPIVKSQATRDTVDTLPVAAILGANASGKSNLIGAMRFMRTMVTESFHHGLRGFPERQPFLLSRASRTTPTLLEVDFVHNDERYQYGFEIDDERVRAEWLHAFPHNRTQLLFDREGGEYQFGRGLSGPNKSISGITRPNALFLSAGALGNHDMLSDIYRWFIFNLKDAALEGRSADSLVLAQRLARHRARLSQLMRLADLGVADARVINTKLDEGERREIRIMVEGMVDKSIANRDEHVAQLIREFEGGRKSVELLHRTATDPMPMPFGYESLGTRTWLSLAAQAIEVLDNGGSLIVDELDSSLHPLLMAEIIEMFQNRLSNKRGAQLVFTTHDTTTLGSMTPHKPLSRGQVWFVEKDGTGASSLTPLSDYRPRKGENIERGYLQGRYGGTPKIAARRLLEVAADGPEEH